MHRCSNRACNWRRGCSFRSGQQCASRPSFVCHAPECPYAKGREAAGLAPMLETLPEVQSCCVHSFREDVPRSKYCHKNVYSQTSPKQEGSLVDISTFYSKIMRSERGGGTPTLLPMPRNWQRNLTPILVDVPPLRIRKRLFMPPVSQPQTRLFLWACSLRSRGWGWRVYAPRALSSSSIPPSWLMRGISLQWSVLEGNADTSFVLGTLPDRCQRSRWLQGKRLGVGSRIFLLSSLAHLLPTKSSCLF